jgi:transposase
MRWDGSTACMAVDGSTDTEVFRAYVQEVLCPTLRADDVVIMDNLSPHKSSQTLQLIQQVGAQVLFLPAYSPDLNPIEKMWSKLKESLRSKGGSILTHTHRGHRSGFRAASHHETPSIGLPHAAIVLFNLL